jgi:hypothetical protein
VKAVHLHLIQTPPPQAAGGADSVAAEVVASVSRAGVERNEAIFEFRGKNQTAVIVQHQHQHQHQHTTHVVTSTTTTTNATSSAHRQGGATHIDVSNLTASSADLSSSFLLEGGGAELAAVLEDVEGALIGEAEAGAEAEAEDAQQNSNAAASAAGREKIDHRALVSKYNSLKQTGTSLTCSVKTVFYANCVV